MRCALATAILRHHSAITTPKIWTFFNVGISIANEAGLSIGAEARQFHYELSIADRLGRLHNEAIAAALGIPEFLTAEMVKPGAVIIDVGITRVPDESKKRGYRIAGDVHFESVAEKARHYQHQNY